MHPDDTPRLRAELTELAQRPAPEPGQAAPTLTTQARMRLDGREALRRVDATAHHAHGDLVGVIVSVVLLDTSDMGRYSGRDPLTGLADRTALTVHLDLALARRERTGCDVGVLFVDLDRFKQVNDERGHEAGDHVLVLAAARLQRCVRPSDLVVRLGGDEFLVVLADLASPEAVTQAADQVLRELSLPYDVSAGVVLTGISASVGAVLAGPHEDSGSLVRRADAAMYEAKAGGRNRVGRGAEGREPAAQALRVRTGMRELEEAWTGGALEVHFQPFLEVATGRLSGAEALLRWRHPEAGVLAASTFLSSAVSAGLMTELSWWAVERALSTFPTGLGLDLYVNLTAEQFTDRDRLAALAERIRGSALAGRVVLELTESALSAEVTHIREGVSLLRATGVRLAIDDFGAGFSSFGRLRHLPCDVLKIDAVLVRDVDLDAAARRILSGVVLMAAGLDLKVVAEGVERPQELALLRAAGVDYVQGHLIAHALAPGDLAELCRTYSTKAG